MKKSFGSKTRRVLAAMVSLAILLGTLVTAAVPTAFGGTVPADKSGYAAAGLKADVVYDFNGKTAGETYNSDVQSANDFSLNVNCATYVKAGNQHIVNATVTEESAGDNSLRLNTTAKDATFLLEVDPGFDQLSYDVYFEDMTVGSTNSPALIYYSTVYTNANDSQKYYTSNYFTIRRKINTEGSDSDNGLNTILQNHNSDMSPASYLKENGKSYNPVGKWITFRYTYGDTYNASTSRKCLTRVEIIDKASGTVVYDQAFNPATNNQATSTRYGDLSTHAVTDEKVYIGVASRLTYKVVRMDNVVASYQKANVAKVKAAIDAIGTVAATPECKANIDAARNLYDALVQADRDLIENYETLTAAEAEYNEMVALGAAAETIAAIEAIGTVENTDACKDKIAAAKALYDALSDEDKAKVENYDKLVAAIEEMEWLSAGLYKDATIDFEDYTVGAYDDSTLPTEAFEFYASAQAGTSLTTQNHFADAYRPQIKDENGNQYISVGVNNSTAYVTALPALPTGEIASMTFKMRLPAPITAANETFGSTFYFYSQKYTGDNGSTYYTSSGFQIGHNNNGYFLRSQGSSILTFDESYDPTKWITVQVNFTDTVITKGTVANQKLFEVTVYDSEGNAINETPLTHAPTTTTQQFVYGVDTDHGANLTNTGNVYMRLFASGSSRYGVEVDDINVVYSNKSATDNMNDVITYFEALQAENSGITDTDFTPAMLEKLAKAVEHCEMLSDVVTADYEDRINALNEFKQMAAPVITGGTIRVATNAADQMLRFNVNAPTVSENLTVTEYGAVMLPSQYLAQDELLTLAKDGVANPRTISSELPERWGSVLLKIPNATEGTNYCGVNITARAYVKVTAGGFTYISYSEAQAERSVNSIAKAMFTRLTDTETYPTDAFGAITYTEGVEAGYGFGAGQTKPANLETVLVFLKANEARIAAIANAQ